MYGCTQQWQTEVKKKTVADRVQRTATCSSSVYISPLLALSRVHPTIGLCWADTMYISYDKWRRLSAGCYGVAATTNLQVTPAFSGTT